MIGAIISYRSRKDFVFPAFMIAIKPAWSCSTGTIASEAATARAHPRARLAAPTASRRTLRRSSEVSDIRRFPFGRLREVHNLTAGSTRSVNGACKLGYATPFLCAKSDAHSGGRHGAAAPAGYREPNPRNIDAAPDVNRRQSATLPARMIPMDLAE